MAQDDNRTLDSYGDAPQTQASGGDEFFDRERWHDVESDEEDRSVAEVRKTNSSLFSVAVLFLITIMAGGAGIVAAYLIPVLIVTDIPPRPMDYTDTPALWVRYSENGVFFCDISDPCCFAASRDGPLFIGNANPPSMHIFSLTGTLETVFPLEAAPRALAWGEPGQAFDGKLLVAFKDEIGVYTPEGKREATLKFPNETADVWSLAIGEDYVFAADSGNRLIHRLDREGKTISFGQKTPERFDGLMVFNAPVSLTVSQKTGLLHVANPGLHRIETFDREGHWERSLSWQSNSADVTGFAGCCNPVGLDTLRDGRIVTSEKDVTRVKVYRPDGRLDCVVAGPEKLGKKPLNLPQLSEIVPSSEDDKKSVFIAALDNDSIVVFDPLWHIVRLFTPNESVPTK